MNPRNRSAKKWWGVAYIAPSFIILLVIGIIPIIASFYYSLTSYDVLSIPTFKGVTNYQEIIGNPAFWQALKNTVIFTIISVPIQVIIAMLLADILARTKEKWLSSFVRSVIYVPVVASMVLVGTVWQFLLSSDYSYVNRFLSALSLPTINFLGDPTMALLSVSILSVWKSVGYFLILFYAGVLDIPRERYEAAAMDGASAFQQFRYVTLPGIRPVTVLCVILSTIWSFQVFDLVYAMTGGGPGNATTTIVMIIYNEGFKQFQMGYASALAMVLIVIIVGFSMLQKRLMKDGD